MLLSKSLLRVFLNITFDYLFEGNITSDKLIWKKKLLDITFFCFECLEYTQWVLTNHIHKKDNHIYSFPMYDDQKMLVLKLTLHCYALFAIKMDLVHR